MKKTYPSIAIVAAVIIVGIIVFTTSSPVQNNYDPDDPDGDDNIPQQHDYVWSGPIGVTQYEHRLGENVYFVVRGLQPHESGTIGIFTPEGILYKTVQYDGTKKSDFNYFFFPDTFAEFDICTPEQLVGIWKVVFADNSYPPLEFKMTDEWLPGGEAAVTVVC